MRHGNWPDVTHTRQQILVDVTVEAKLRRGWQWLELSLLLDKMIDKMV